MTQTPNPEVPESMDRAEALAEEHQRRPGARHRPRRRPHRRAWRPTATDDCTFITGNQIARLADAFQAAKLARERHACRGRPIVVKTLVTTTLVTRIARHFKAQVVDNLLVGFKYIADVLWQLEAARQLRGRAKARRTISSSAAEESHGILVTPQIRDKDAGGAALLLAELALDQKAPGPDRASITSRRLERQFGYFKNDVRNIIMPGIEGKVLMARMLDRLRKSPPKKIGGLAVTAFDDLQDEAGWMGPSKARPTRPLATS